MRRIEAVTGKFALDYSLQESQSLEKIRELLGSHGSDPVDKLSKTLAEKRLVEKELQQMIDSWASNISKELLANADNINEITVIVHDFGTIEMERMKLVGDAIRARNGKSVALLTSLSASGAGQLCCVVGDKLIAEGRLKAGDLVGKAAKIAGGGGGGRPHMATAGAKTGDKLELALTRFPELIRKAMGVN